MQSRAWRSVALAVVGTALGIWRPDLGARGSFLFAVALIVGLPHGALDHRLAHMWGGWRSLRGQLGFHAVYLVGVVVALLGWVLVPAAGLVLLLATSAWHFGESDLLHLSRKLRRPSVVWSRGLMIVMGPFLAHPDEAARLFAEVAGPGTPLAAVLPSAELGTALAFGLVVVHGALVAASGRDFEEQSLALLDVLGVAFLTLGGGPVVGIGLYFLLWHTPDHFASVLRHETARGAGLRTILADAAPRTAVSLVGLLVLAWWVDPSLWTRWIVWGVGCLALPHALIVHFAFLPMVSEERLEFASGRSG